MSRGKRKQLPVLENIEILDAAAEGKCIARVGDLVLFVTGAVPGDVVDVQLTRKKSTFLEGYPVKLIKASTRRAEPFCEHFGICGGCKWQNMQYADQLYFKQKQVMDHLQRIGHLTLPEPEPILAAPETTFYRNKLEFTFSDRKWLTEQESGSAEIKGLGFHIPGRYDKIVDVNKCWLQPDPSNEIRNVLRSFCFEHNLDFQNLKYHKGFLRTLMIRTSTTGEVMVVVMFGENDEENINLVLNFLANRFPAITSLMYVINTKLNDTLGDLEVQNFKGPGYILEEMEGLKFIIGPKSFYQTNSRQAYELYKLTRKYAGITDSDLVYDLYTGTGTIANFVARGAGKVVGIEYVPEAIVDAKRNSELNGIVNTQFFAGDMKDILTTGFMAEVGMPDVIITDPPRAGMHPDVVEGILHAAPRRIVYVSCNSATQARDLQLMDSMYSIERVRPVDMFPHTHHVENIVSLVKR